DKRLVFATKDDLVCVADASIAAATAASTPSAGDAPTPAASGVATTSMKQPIDIDGVLLEDGRQIEGTYDLTDRTKLTIHPKDGSPDFDVPIESVVAAEKGGTVEVRGDDAAASAVWRGAVRGAYCDAMEDVFKEY